MNLRARLARLTNAMASRPRADEIWMVVWHRAGTTGAGGRPPGLYQRGNAADLVHAGDEPDPAVLARLHARMRPGALTVVCGPEVVSTPDPPLDPAGGHVGVTETRVGGKRI